MKARLAIAIALVLIPTQAMCDEERPNVPIVSSGDDGTCYAKSLPVEYLGTKGTTTVYDVRRGLDRRRESYNWYSNKLYVLCNYLDNGNQAMIARMGRWAEGRTANDSDVAIAFYRSGRLLKQYSTLDIAGSPSNVQGSVSHYVVFSDIQGWTWMENLDGKSCCSIFFLATTADGKQVRFSPYSGERIPSALPKQNSQSPKKNKAPH